MSKLELKEIFAAVDSDAKDIWEELDDDQKKALIGDFFILNRYISSVKNNTGDYQEYYVQSTNEFYNKHWNTLAKQHPELLWKLLCMCSYGDGKLLQREWIGFKNKKSGTDKGVKFLAELYPTRKMDEIELMAKLMSPADIKELARSHGYEDSQIKKLL